jgi:hypothetical protein
MKTMRSSNQPASRITLGVSALMLLAALGGAAEKRTVRFNCKDLGGWRAPTGQWQTVKAVSLDPADAKKFVAAAGKGVLYNGPETKTVDLVTEEEFGDLEAHVEFCIASHSNSGVYVMGNYEVQIYDSYGVEKDKYPGIECGGIYPRWIQEQNAGGHSPRVNASKPPGQWQSFDITFRAPRFDANGKKIENARFVRVVQNGKVIHENVELTGPTRGGLSEQERPTGPLRFQGDHGPVAYRNLKVKALNLK